MWGVGGWGCTGYAGYPPVGNAGCDDGRDRSSGISPFILSTGTGGGRVIPIVRIMRTSHNEQPVLSVQLDLAQGPVVSIVSMGGVYRVVWGMGIAVVGVIGVGLCGVCWLY
jgi:hypothetical protein